jgi:hypothetical protein
MSTLSELRKKQMLTPSEMKRFGKRVRYFSVYESLKKDEETLHEAKERVFDEIAEHIKKTGGQLYTGIHSENCWDVLRWWDKGAHLANRTLDFAVLSKE